MISKELLGEVLGRDAHPYDYVQNGRALRYAFFESINRKRHINIYELAYKCKEWAFDKGYSLESAKKAVLGEKNKMTSTWICCGLTPTCEVLPNFTADTEPEAIFEACEWIRSNK